MTAFFIFLKSFCIISKKMSSIRFKFPFKFNLTGKHKKQSTSRLVSETNVSKEYLDVFRTKSYIDICHKVQSHIGLDNESSSSCDRYIRQFDILCEPEKETMANLAKTFDMHCLILDFLNAGLESWKICEKLLGSVHQAKSNYHRIKRVIKVAERVPKDDQHVEVYKELALYSSLANPLSDFSPEKFPKMHHHLNPLLKRLTTHRTRIKRKRKLIICLKKGVGCALVASYSVLVLALLVLALHGLVGIVTSSGLFACSLGLTNKAKMTHKGLNTGELKRVSVLLDVAAKGIYTLIKDFDTIGSLAGRLHNEVEFGRAVARNCVGNLKSDTLEEVMKEFRVHESRFMEQMEELKDHVYLCLLNVNRSRRALVEEMVPCT
ncbi:hypothetical protein HanRHA438_Chr13g0577481 [Helianthus annuus]|nr:hypothetical protein HanHA300_Chr13g0464071 [Helianthus annuus]KAJ0479109.1 hypothetical protein HanIR_Chr13g0616341 [Helianthus annuus]KAJ0856347.1 hypothetical protein HanRHA438_Chr13g0577481 [Helianthus annuus]